MKIRGTGISLLSVALLLPLGTTSARADKKSPALAGQALVDAYVACWKQFNDKRWDEFGRCYSATSSSIFPGLPAVKGSKAILDQHAKPFKTAFPDAAGEQQLVVVDGPQLASVSLMRGTHQGPLAGPGGSMPATGKSLGQLVAHVIVSGAGAAAQKEWFVQDAPTMLAQLGAAPAEHARKAIKAGVPAPKVVISTGSAEEKANLAANRKLYEAFNEQDRAVFEAFAEDIVDHNQSLPADLVGKKAVSEFVASFWGMSSKGKMQTPTMFAAGQYVVAAGTYEGVNDGNMAGIGLKKTGKRFKLDIVEITRWENGKVKEFWPFFNGGQMAAQLGLLPPPAKHAQR